MPLPINIMQLVLFADVMYRPNAKTFCLLLSPKEFKVLTNPRGSTSFVIWCEFTVQPVLWGSPPQHGNTLEGPVTVK